MDCLLNLFKPTDTKLTIQEIINKLGYQRLKRKELNCFLNDLKRLELEGICYYNKLTNCYETFPSSFLIVKIIKKDNDKLICSYNNKKIEISIKKRTKVNKNSYAIINKNNELISIINELNDYSPSKDVDTLKELFNPYNVKYTLKELVSITNIPQDKLIEELSVLEEKGYLYYDEYENVYKILKPNMTTSTVNISKKGSMMINYHGKIYFLPKNTKGLMPFDIALFKIENNEIKLIKVIKRTNPEVVCEVVNKNTIKVVGNKNISVCEKEEKFEKLNLPVGTRFLAKLTTKEHNSTYEVEFIEVLGHTNDLDSELEAIAYNNGFTTRYTKEELEQIYNTPTTLREEDKIGRVDRTKDNTFTIDGRNCKDMDDAISIKKLDNGNFLLVVSIADVSHYIPFNSPLWQRAVKNTTSVYLVESVSHMLHPQISNGICSLNELEERLAKSYVMEIDKKGNIIDFYIENSIIKSKKKMAYEDVNEFLENNNLIKGYEDFQEDLLLMQELSHILENRRSRNGMLDFDSKEINFKLDDEKNIIDITTRKEREAEKIIENFMIVTNEAVAEYMQNLGINFIYRNNEVPFTNKIKETIEIIKALGYHIDFIDKTDDPHVLQKIIKSISNKEEFFILSNLLIRNLQKAYFSTNNAGHFALALDQYSQTTAPIRRLMDLVIEYIIDNIDNEFLFENYDLIKNQLEELCKRASMMERCADKAEYEANKLYMVDYMKNKQDKEFIGYVEEIKPGYIIVKTQNLIEGTIYVNDIDDGFYTYNPECKWLENRKNKHRIIIGSKLKLTVKELDREYRTIFFYGNTNITNEQTLTRKRG